MDEKGKGSFTIRRGKEKENMLQEKREEVQKWMEEVLEETYGDTFHDSIRDGVNLCRLMMRIAPETISTPAPKPTKHVLKMIENVEEFLRALKKYGVKKAFSPHNLVEPKNDQELLDVYLVIADLKRSFKRKRAQAEAQSTPPSPRNGSDTPSPTSEIATTQHIQIASPVITIQQQHPEEKRLRKSASTDTEMPGTPTKAENSTSTPGTPLSPSSSHDSISSIKSSSSKESLPVVTKSTSADNVPASIQQTTSTNSLSNGNNTTINNTTTSTNLTESMKSEQSSNPTTPAHSAPPTPIPTPKLEENHVNNTTSTTTTSAPAQTTTTTALTTSQNNHNNNNGKSEQFEMTLDRFSDSELAVLFRLIYIEDLPAVAATCKRWYNILQKDEDALLWSRISSELWYSEEEEVHSINMSCKQFCLAARGAFPIILTYNKNLHQSPSNTYILMLRSTKFFSRIVTGAGRRRNFVSARNYVKASTVAELDEMSKMEDINNFSVAASMAYIFISTVWEDERKWVNISQKIDDDQLDLQLSVPFKAFQLILQSQLRILRNEPRWPKK